MQIANWVIRHRLSLQDAAILVSVLFCAGFLALEYDLLRDWGEVSEHKEKIRVEEVFVLGAILMGGLLIFIWRRMQEHKSELARHVAAEKSAHQLARHDLLTGLPNRKLFTELASDALGRAWAQGSSCAVMFIDLDNFKPVNDTYGHAVGDAVLVEIADRLRDCLPGQAGHVARFGGDEFACLIEFGAGSDVHDLAARRILREVQRPVLIDGTEIVVGATIGVAVGPQHGRRAEDLIHAADLAMYQGKRGGRSAIVLFEPGPKSILSSPVQAA